MNKKTIKQLSSMQAEIMAKLKQKENVWKNIVSAYEQAWKADDFYNHLPPDEQLEQISFAMYFAEVIGEISLGVMNKEAEFLSLAQDVITQVDAVEAEIRKAQSDLKPELVKFGDVAGYKVLRLATAMEKMETLKSNAETSLECVKIMCDITGAGGTESEGYQQYSRIYNLLAKFLHKPLRGYAEEDLPSMSIDELEYVEAQISVRERTERMDAFSLTYLETVRKRITERIAFRKALLANDNFPDF